jgi:predicted Zn-dependent protease
MSTHPDPGNRARVAVERAQKVAKEMNLDQLKVERDRYLGQLAGMTFGDDPRQGFFRGNTFLHPDLEFQMTFPQGWKAQNTPSAVVAVSDKQDAAFQLSAAGKISPEDATKRFFQQEGVKAAQVSSGSIQGLPATASYFEAQTQEGALRGIVSFIAHEGVTFQLVGYTPAQAFSAYDPVLRQTIGSFGPLTDSAARSVQAAKVEIVRVPRDMSLAEFNAQFPSTVPLETVALVNGLEKDGRFPAGARAKRVTGGTPAQTLMK